MVAELIKYHNPSNNHIMDLPPTELATVDLMLIHHMPTTTVHEHPLLVYMASQKRFVNKNLVRDQLILC